MFSLDCLENAEDLETSEFCGLGSNELSVLNDMSDRSSGVITGLFLCFKPYLLYFINYGNVQ